MYRMYFRIPNNSWRHLGTDIFTRTQRKIKGESHMENQKKRQQTSNLDILFLKIKTIQQLMKATLEPHDYDGVRQQMQRFYLLYTCITAMNLNSLYIDSDMKIWLYSDILVNISLVSWNHCQIKLPFRLLIFWWWRLSLWQEQQWYNTVVFIFENWKNNILI